MKTFESFTDRVLICRVETTDLEMLLKTSYYVSLVTQILNITYLGMFLCTGFIYNDEDYQKEELSFEWSFLRPNAFAEFFGIEVRRRKSDEKIVVVFTYLGGAKEKVKKITEEFSGDAEQVESFVNFYKENKKIYEK